MPAVESPARLIDAERSLERYPTVERRGKLLCCAVLRYAAGDKWSMQQFIRVGHFSRRGGKPIHQTVNPAPVLPYVDCPDLGSSECKGMSQAQCHSHRDYYIGNVTHPGSCLSRCMRCDIWREHLKLKAGKGEGAEAAHPRPQT